MFRILQPFLVLALLAASSLALADEHLHDDPVKQELHDVLDRFLAGVSTNEARFHDRFWADDLVYTSSSGERFGKAAIMQGMSDETPEEEPVGPTYGAEDVEIRLFGDVAVVTFRLVADIFDDTTVEYFNTGVFQRRDGQWKAFTWQATEIPEKSR